MLAEHETLSGSRPTDELAPNDAGGDHLTRARLVRLMERTRGREDVRVALLDGPIDANHPELRESRWFTIGERNARGVSSMETAHGTFVAGILAGRRDGRAPAICPGCTFLHRVLFEPGDGLHATTPAGLAAALHDAVEAGAHVVNLSAAMIGGTPADARGLRDALDEAAARGTIVVVAAGNGSVPAGSVLTQHPWVVPVVSYGLDGRASADSTLGPSIGRYGVGAPGAGVTSLAPDGGFTTLSGSSIAVPFVAGAAALLRSLLAGAGAGAIRSALVASVPRRRLVPPLMDAERSYAMLAGASS